MHFRDPVQRIKHMGEGIERAYRAKDPNKIRVYLARLRMVRGNGQVDIGQARAAYVHGMNMLKRLEPEEEKTDDVGDSPIG